MFKFFKKKKVNNIKEQDSSAGEKDKEEINKDNLGSSVVNSDKQNQGQGNDDSQGSVRNNDDQDKKKEKNSSSVGSDDMMSAAMAGMMGGGGDIKEMLKNIDTSGMSLKEKMGLKMLQKMPRKKQEEILRQALNPQELYKNKDKVLGQIDAMVASGQIEKGQAEAVKAQMGLR
jgi:hypothetical protein